MVEAEHAVVDGKEEEPFVVVELEGKEEHLSNSDYAMEDVMESSHVEKQEVEDIEHTHDSLYYHSAQYEVAVSAHQADETVGVVEEHNWHHDSAYSRVEVSSSSTPSHYLHNTRPRKEPDSSPLVYLVLQNTQYQNAPIVEHSGSVSRSNISG